MLQITPLIDKKKEEKDVYQMEMKIFGLIQYDMAVLLFLNFYEISEMR